MLTEEQWGKMQALREETRRQKAKFPEELVYPSDEDMELNFLKSIMKLLFKPLAYLLPILFLASVASCKDDCEKEYPFRYRHALVFNILDEKTGQDLLQIGVHRYFRDTVDIYDESLNPLGIHPDTDGSMVLNFSKHNQIWEEPLNTPIEHTYYIYFEEGDYDTLGITYQIGLDECQDKVLIQGSVRYNDSLYIEYLSTPRDTWGASFIKERTTK